VHVKETTQLIGGGYDYVYEVDNLKLFRKRK